MSGVAGTPDALAEAEAWAADDQHPDAESEYEQWMFADDPRGPAAFLYDTPDDGALLEDFLKLTECARHHLDSPEGRKAFALFRNGILAGRMLANPARSDSAAVIDTLRDGAGALQAKRRRLESLVKDASAHLRFTPLAVGAFIKRAAATWPSFAQLDPAYAEQELCSVKDKDAGTAAAARLSKAVNGFGIDGNRPLDKIKADFKSARTAGRKRVLKT